MMTRLRIAAYLSLGYVCLTAGCASNGCSDRPLLGRWSRWWGSNNDCCCHDHSVAVPAVSAQPIGAAPGGCQSCGNGDGPILENPGSYGLVGTPVGGLSGVPVTGPFVVPNGGYTMPPSTQPPATIPGISPAPTTMPPPTLAPAPREVPEAQPIPAGPVSHKEPKK